jgi:hypothetical protein
MRREKKLAYRKQRSYQFTADTAEKATGGNREQQRQLCQIHIRRYSWGSERGIIKNQG